MYIVINGGGTVGEFLAGKLLAKGHEVAIIERKPDVAQHLADVLAGRQLVICGDGCDSNNQRDAGTERADVFVSVTGKDDDNLVSCEIATTVFDVPRTIARVNNPKNIKIFKKVGIEPVSSTNIIVQIIEEEAFAGDIAAVSSLRRNNMGILELDIPVNSRFYVHPRPVREIVLPAGSLIIAVSDKDGYSPVAPTTTISAGDSLIMLVKTGDEALARRALHVRES